jgi:hypothetical protein
MNEWKKAQRVIESGRRVAIANERIRQLQRDKDRQVTARYRAESKLEGQQEAGRIMMAVIERQRALLSAHGIVEDYDFDTPPAERDDWPAPS